MLFDPQHDPANLSNQSLPSLSVLETCLYANDLKAAESFYSGVLGLALVTRDPDRHIFFELDNGMLLIFDPAQTGTHQTSVNGSLIPKHGAHGPGHFAMQIDETDLPLWRAQLAGHSVPIESEVNWPNGAVSLYFRDPAGNSIELATGRLWGR